MRNDTELFMQALMDYEDEFCGTVDDIGYHSLIRGSIGMDSFVGDKDMLELYHELDVEFAGELYNMAGCIVRQNDSGFIYWEIYRSSLMLDAAWSEVERSMDEFYEDAN